MKTLKISLKGEEKMKKIVCLLLVLVSITGLVFAGGDKEASSEGVRSVVCAHTGNEASTYQVGMLKFKEEVEKLTDGRFVVDVYPKTLGGDKELMESLQIGTVDVAEINLSVLASIVPELSVFDLPYLFDSREHTYRVFDGEVGDYFIELVKQRTNLIPVAYWENGFRNFTNDVRPIVKADDLKGIKMRTMESNIHLQSFKLWGADPTPMGFNEMLTAMQQGVIHGHDNNIDTVVSNSMWEFQKYFSESWHFYSGKMLIFSSKFWNSLSDSDKELFTTSMERARDRERQECTDKYESSLKKLKDGGMQIITKSEVDSASFRNRVLPIWSEYTAKYGDKYLNMIENLK